MVQTKKSTRLIINWVKNHQVLLNVHKHAKNEPTLKIQLIFIMVQNELICAHIMVIDSVMCRYVSIVPDCSVRLSINKTCTT